MEAKPISPEDPVHLRARIEAGERSFVDVDLSGADLMEAQLAGLDFTRANLRQAELSSAVLTGADFSEANLMAAHLDGALCESANFAEANLMGAILSRAQLAAADVTRANLVYSDARETDFSDADLCGSDLSGADLCGADLSGANLVGATLVGTRLVGADLSGAELDSADLTDAQLSPDVDLLGCEWERLVVAGTVFERAQVESGVQVLPVGRGDPLLFIFQSTRPLSGPDLVAISDLVRLFSHLVPRGSLSFEMSSGGSRVVLGCGATSARGYVDAFDLALRLIDAACDAPGAPSRTRLTRELADGLRELSSRPPPPDNREELGRMLSELDSSADAIARVLTAFEPVRLQMRDAEDVRAFRDAAEARGVSLDDLLGAGAGWTLLPRFLAHYLQLPLESPLLPTGLLER